MTHTLVDDDVVDFGATTTTTTTIDNGACARTAPATGSGEIAQRDCLVFWVVKGTRTKALGQPPAAGGQDLQFACLRLKRVPHANGRVLIVTATSLIACSDDDHDDDDDVDTLTKRKHARTHPLN